MICLQPFYIKPLASINGMEKVWHFANELQDWDLAIEGLELLRHYQIAISNEASIAPHNTTALQWTIILHSGSIH